MQPLNAFVGMKQQPAEEEIWPQHLTYGALAARS